MKTQTCNGTRLVTAVERQSCTRKSPELIDAAERQIQQWLLAHRGRGQAAPTVNGRRPVEVGPYLAISRESGSGGGQIARLIGKMTGWEILDRELLECLAERYRASPAVLGLVDEATANGITEIFGNATDPDCVTQTQYMFHLGRVVLMAARAGKVIYVGRGAHFLLPHRRGLIVRLVASLGYRVQQIVERRRLSYDKARDYVEKTDAGRQDFVRQYFHRDIADPHLYDLMVNVERIGPQQTADLIARALVSCFGAGMASEPSFMS